MNIKKAIILTIILSVVFSMGIVAASDNATEDSLSSDADINITFDEQMWENNLTDIDVQLPENTTGNFSVKINDEKIYDEKITNTSFKVPIKLPKDKFVVIANIWPPMDSRTYRVSAFLNDVELNAPNSLKIMRYSPDYNFFQHFPTEILQNDNQNSLTYSMIVPRSANGYLEIYIDDRLFSKSKVNPPFVDLSSLTSLSLGKHTLKLLYSEDTYYRSANKTLEFEVVQALINIPDPINIGHDDCISVRTMVESRVNIYIDSVLISSQKTDNGEVILSLEQYLKNDSQKVTVVVSNSQFTRQKTADINVSYDFDVYPTHFVYGEENILDVFLPDTLNNNLLVITIDGVKWPFWHEEYIANNIIELDLSKLQAGNHTLFMSYPGDNRFKPYSKTVNLTVENAIMHPYDIVFKDGSKVYLNLPADAEGFLNVYIDGVLFKSVKLINGHGEVTVDSLKPGKYQLSAQFTGNDYYVKDISIPIWANPKITVDEYFKVGEAKKITLEVPKDAKGWMIVDINGKQYKKQIVNGKATLSLKSLKIGEYDVEVTYLGEDGFKTTDYYYIEVIPTKVKIIASNVNVLYKHKCSYKIKLFGRDGKALKNKWIKVKIAKKTYKVKTNRKGVATLKLSKLKLKTYTLKISYGKVKVTKKIHVKLISLTKTKKYLKAKLYKKLKGKTVIFKMNGKKIKVKTNSNGIAQLKLSKVTGKVVVSYLKSSVKTVV